MKFLYTCLLGLLAVIPSVVFQLLVPPLSFSNPFLILLHGIFVIGLIEEGSKALAFYLFPLKFLDAKKVFLYGFFLGLSFGLFELVVYFVSGVGAIGLRFFTAVFFHAFSAVLDCFFIYSLKQKQRWFFPFVFSVVMHGLYNFFASFTDFFWSFSIVVLVFVGLQSFYVYDRFCKVEKV